jgi:CHRD domain
MRRRGMRLVKVSILLGLVVATMVAPRPAFSELSPAEFAPKQTTLVTDNMTGAQVVPGPGDPDGFGTARLPNDVEVGQICWNINTERIDVPLTGALIQAGSAGQVGQVRITLFDEEYNPDPSGCKPVEDSELQRDLNQKSREFYLQINNVFYTSGAIRGQLHHEQFDG